MSLHWIRGARGFVVAVVLAAAMPAAAQSVQPTAPIAINEDIFNGTVKGFLPPDEVLLSTKLSSVAFSGFFRSASASAVAGYVSDPADIPSLQTGNVIKLGRLRAGRVYTAIGAKMARRLRHRRTRGRVRGARPAGDRPRFCDTAHRKGGVPGQPQIPRCAGRHPRPADARAVTGAWRARVTHRVPPVAHNGTPDRARPRRWAGFRRHGAC